jgi:hypothetical protein
LTAVTLPSSLKNVFPCAASFGYTTLEGKRRFGDVVARRYITNVGGVNNGFR